MWRNSAVFIPILLLISATSLSPTYGVIHTEGGSFTRETDQPYGSSDSGDYDVLELQRTPTSQRQLASIVDELSQARNSELSNEEEEEGDVVPLELLIEAAKQQERDAQLARERAGRNSGVNFRDPNEEEIEELQKFGRKFQELQQGGSEHAAAPEYEPQLVEVEEESEPKTKPTPKQSPKGEKEAPKKEKPLTAQKKGQSEFVEFVEPAHVKATSNKLKNVEFMEKRVADGGERVRAREEHLFGLISSSGNVLFVAFVTMCCALTVVGVVGGTYYYKHVRAEREDPFDDFTRYSPAGPGKQLKRGMSPNFTNEKGDETLAYRAQLHHYQQTKQKIIGSGDDVLGSPGSGGLGNGRMMGGAMIDDDTDKSEDEGELEHNFSVYECPGLAPTGDIEVQNPNFVDNSGGAGASSKRVASPQSPQHRS